MKQKLPKPSLSSFWPLAVVVAIALFYHPPQPLTAPVSPPITPSISTHSTSVHIKTKAILADAKPRHSSPPVKENKLALNAPKQKVIAQSVTTEYAYHIFGTVNDPRAATDWTLGTDNAPAAWDISTGNNSTVVAVIDTGFALAHQDLVNQWYQNTSETGVTQAGDRCWTGTPANKKTNNCDDDNNGYIDDWRGWNFDQGDNNPQAGRTNPTGDGVDHGTEVAGLVGASGNNGLGSSAIDQNTKIMPLTALDDYGTGYTSDIVAAIYYAVDNGANVINLSLGTYNNDPASKTAIDYAVAHGVVVVAAAGNCGDGTDPTCPVTLGAIGYPAAYPNVISVGATTQSSNRASFGSYGKELDVSAPGYNLPVSTTWSAGNPTSLYASGLYGTSFSSPQVASLATLIKSIRPSSSPADIAALIEATASKPAGMGGLFYTEQFGHGIIDAYSALTVATALNTSSAVPALLQTGSASFEHILSASSSAASGCVVAVGTACTVQFTNSGGFIRYLPYSIISPSGNTGWSWNTNMLESDNWEVRARQGDVVSTTPYLLLKKS